MINLNEKIEELLESQVREKQLSDMDLRSIFREYYDGFNKIRLNVSVFSRSNKLENITYVKLIQKLLAENGVLQKNGEPITLDHIRTEMYVVGQERNKKGSKRLDSVDSLPVDSQPTGNLNRQGKGEVSKPVKKSVVAPKTIEAVEIPLNEYASEMELLTEELNNKDRVALVWSGRDEYTLTECSRLAKLNSTKIELLAANNHLLPKYNLDVKNYFFVWIRKAREMGKIK
ncbi:hypothetical protein SAMN05192566_0739 [Methylophilus rhizosphaerae]|uniref:Uncharacterized protein n=1 Tax=Methylophilus rhizosphaerae TaxID=492660 RepID=A0A1G9A890_9PROT|nr:hypothetical protein [Methylophilus rhizosphaerae]SDK23471.1 hypothetical protein SAMN05192566_0739 [Methylophilus rhizosphaerae]